MRERLRAIARVFVGVYLIVLHLFAGFLAVKYFYPDFHPFALQPVATIAEPDTPTPVPTPLPVPSQLAGELPPESPQPIPLEPEPPSDQLMIPVKGVKRSQLQDTFSDARSNGRVHDAIDIMAPGGTPVLAAADGEIIKFWDSVAGGVTIYELTADKRYILYYAHLQSRQPGLNEHDQVKRGQVIAYVGDTGNAGPGNYHLHFAIAEAIDPKRWWSGPYINPFPLLNNGIESP